MSDHQNFQVNLGGVIRLLSDHLYSGPEVYVRELLQNAVDAITARQLADPQHVGRISVEVNDTGGEQPGTLTVEDDGVGLTEQEVHQFLATIGQSSKQDLMERDDFIGQFGIGLLSGFLVSDEITVITQSFKPAAAPVEWRGRADGTYSVRTLATKLEVGTRVYLQPKADMEAYFEAEKVTDLLRHFGHHLPYSIQVRSGGQSTTLNEPPPWNIPYATADQQREALLQYGREVFEIAFLDAIPLKSERGNVQGVAFVLPFAASVAGKQSHRVYLKNMLLAESVEGLMPDWAFFVRCVVNADRLRPNAAREAFFEDDMLADARQQLGQCLRDYLIGLAKNDRRRLDQIIDLHYMPIKALAVEEDEFFHLMIDWLPFETSLGQMTLEDYCRDHSEIRYVATRDQFRQIASVANAQNMCVFNAGYSYDLELLEKVHNEFPHRNVERVEVDDLVQDFEELSLEEREAAFNFIKLSELVLQPYKCGGEVRKFEPVDLPTLYTASDAASFLRSVDQSKEHADELWSGILENVANAATPAAYAQLVFNFRCPLVRRLIGLENRELQRRIIELLYVQALMLGHYPLQAKELAVLGEGLLGLIEHFLDRPRNEP